MKNAYKGFAEYKAIIKDNEHLIKQYSQRETPVTADSLKKFANALAMTTIVMRLAVKTLLSIDEGD